MLCALEVDLSTGQRNRSRPTTTTTTTVIGSREPMLQHVEEWSAVLRALQHQQLRNLAVAL